MFCTSFLLKQPLEHLNHLLSYQLSHTRKTITIPLIIWTSDTFRWKLLFFFLDGLQHVPLAHLLLCPQKNLQCIQSFNSLSSFLLEIQTCVSYAYLFFNCSHQSSPPFQGVIALLSVPLSCPTLLPS